MDLLKALGIDDTLWIHAVCFAVAYFALSNLLFKPYLKSLQEREKRTVGGEELATQLLSQAVEIGTNYEQKAKAISSAVRVEYDKARGEALKEQEELVTRARSEAAKLLESSRLKITAEIESARAVISREIPSVTSAIASKLAGKEISL